MHRPSFRIPVIRRRHPPGTSPGTLTVDPRAEAPAITVIAYGPESHARIEITRIEEIEELVRKWPVVWLNVDGLGDLDLVREIGDHFGLHRLALEDIVNVHQRAKVEPYEEHLFIVARMIRQVEGLQSEQVSMFVGNGFLLTFQERAGDSFDYVRQRIASGRGIIRDQGADYLMYALLDALIDGYFPVLETYGEHIESLEDRIVLAEDGEAITEIHRVKRELLMIRRSIWPHREMLNGLLRDRTRFVTPETLVYLRDCYDHVVQVLDIVETYRELASGLLDLHLTSVSNRMNEVMKVLTIFAAIFIPLTFIAGLYGMNFKWMPELEWKWAYPAVLGIMAIVSVTMLLFFRRRRWL